ncbi:nuclear valosin-containing protein-like [Centruroides sculpturatus]|uniref:nuclear valosin-containing protein-like n=1 Tax=Centruroides sculpturatus TaxID=218467 RepID=UPI000C6D0BE3|nr:nuclear valosin-containing protein-like [Centruroides sculpturatus]
MDYISLKASARNKRSLPFKVNRNPKRNKMMFAGDPRFLPRVKQLLFARKHSSVVDVDKLVADLQQTYPEYRRKKHSAFRRAVDSAIDKIEEETETSKSCVGEKGEGSIRSGGSDQLPDSDFSPDNENYVVYEDTNMVNKSITDLYRRSPARSLDSHMTKRSTTPKESSHRRIVEGESAGSTPNVPVVVGMEDEKCMKNYASRTTLSEEEVIKSSIGNRRPLRTSESIISKKLAGKKKDAILQQPGITFSDIGGIEPMLQEICKLLVHMKHPEVYQRLGVTPPRGFLLHGPPGCGKTLLAHAIAGQLELPFIKIAATEVVSGVSGESEEKIRDLFDKAVNSAPCILFIDEIDAITPKRETAQREMERRIVAQLLTCMDELNQKHGSAQVLVIGATNRPDALDPALRRAGRFDREICLGIPDEDSRNRILRVLCRQLKLESGFDFQWLAKRCPGFVGADLMALTREAATVAINRIFNNLQESSQQFYPGWTSNTPSLVGTPDSNLSVDTEFSQRTNHCGGENPDSQSLLSENPVDELQSVLSWLRDQPPLTEEQLQQLFVEKSDFEAALKVVQPSAKREGFVTVPDVTWDDIGALKDIQEELKLSILAPVQYREQCECLGLTNPVGILLCGPPGCGKTLLAKAIANESGINFISVKGPELLNMYVGESERAVRQCFQRASNSAPCIIFFDEIDALCPRRSDTAEGGATARVVNQMLTEMDGLESRKNVFIMGATNRPDILDPAMLRPGRLDKILFVGLPTASDRVEILKTITKNGTRPLLNDDVNIVEIGNSGLCTGFTGADLSSLVREASLVAFKEYLQLATSMDIKDIQLKVSRHHFDAALKKIRPSITAKDQKLYERLKITKCSVAGFNTKLDEETFQNSNDNR